MTTKEKAADKTEALERLREILKPGDTVTTVLRHVSSSGMYRVIDLFKFYTDDDGKVRRWWLSDLAVRAGIGRTPRGGREGVGVSGCGMDMGFHLVYSLSVALFCPDGYTHEGAYALKHEWL